MSVPRLSLAVLAAASLAVATPCRAEIDGVAIRAAAKTAVDHDYPAMQALYEGIHRHPEIAFQEVKTAQTLAGEMRRLGFDVSEHVGGTGLVAFFRNGPGPTILVRTELDALPMEEKTGLPYASHDKTVFDGHETYVAHTCGHDIHMTVWVETAKTLLAMKDQWHGTLMFVAQPAEETLAGARAMLADGLYSRFGKPDFALALHDTPAAYGTINYRVGVTTSNADNFEITFKGKGGHGAAPDKTIDPIVVAAHFITDVQSVVAREKDPEQAGVITVGAIQGGTVGNIIPDSVTLRGTIRSFDPAVRAKLLAGFDRTAHAAAMMAGAPAPDIRIVQSVDAVLSDAGVVDATAKGLKAAFGDKFRPSMFPVMASEDFSHFSEGGVPSMMFQIGVYEPERVAAARAGTGPELPPNHSPFFAPVPRPTMETGVEAMTIAVIEAFAQAPQLKKASLAR